MILCNGCKNAGEIISIVAELNATKAHVGCLVEQLADRDREIDRQAGEIGRMGLELRDYRLGVRKDGAGNGADQ